MPVLPQKAGTVHDNPSVGAGMIAGHLIDSTHLSPPPSTAVVPSKAPMGPIASLLAGGHDAVNPQSGSGGTSSPPSSNDGSGTDTGTTGSGDPLVDLAAQLLGEAGTGALSPSAAGDTPEAIMSTDPSAAPAASGGGGKGIVIIGIIIGLALGGWYIFKNRKKLAKAAKDAVPGE